ncbi:MAG TPA: 3-isopropylmalate dehydratase small subunit [Terriglobales bacterium]|nr:3-isopropylmalate dehydratase small subunit [Terriglobales bacterium]
MANAVLKLGDDVSTDIIYPGRYMATVLPTETPQYAFADIPDFNARLKRGEIPAGSIVVAGKNFGCGSSREQAASCLKGPELVIIARHFARIFLQNSINLGLRTVICPDIEAEVGDEIEVTDEKVINKTSGKSFDMVPLPAARQAIIDAGGLIAFTRQRLLQQAQTKL